MPTSLKSHLKERLGLLIFLIIAILGALLIYFLQYSTRNSNQASLLITLKEETLSSPDQDSKKNIHKHSDHQNHKIHLPLNSVNPNTADLNEWRSLGLSEKQAQVIINYRNKGGTFYSKHDLAKIYVLKEQHLNKMLPYLSFETKITPKNNESSPPLTSNSINYIEINTATASELETIKGIGPVLSKRIINFRNQLGGFYHKNQLNEVYHLPEETFLAFIKVITIDTSSIQKINLNLATSSELSNHPYLRPYQKQILHYRKKHGKFNDLEQLKEVLLINDENFRKIAPYLAL